MLSTDNAVLVLIDVQEKLTSVMHDRDALVENLVKLVKGALLLGIPIIRFEQNPEKMGKTISELDALLHDAPPITKMSFGCCGVDGFVDDLFAMRRKQVLIAGIETHVCVYQTAVELIRGGYSVEVVVDAVSSRRASDKEVGLAKIQACGAHSAGSGQGHVTSVETALFELMRSAEHPNFRDMLRVVK
ncbi:MAG: hydrolase [Verrucomicrobia bacterium]|nr:hydrolase [Verrucomicrobiota bacterium]